MRVPNATDSVLQRGIRRAPTALFSVDRDRVTRLGAGRSQVQILSPRLSRASHVRGFRRSRPAEEPRRLIGASDGSVLTCFPVESPLRPRGRDFRTRSLRPTAHAVGRHSMPIVQLRSFRRFAYPRPMAKVAQKRSDGVVLFEVSAEDAADLEIGADVEAGRIAPARDGWPGPFGALAGEMPSIEIKDVKVARRRALQGKTL